MASTGSVVSPEDVREWGQQLDEVARRIGARFSRSETRDRVRAYLIGLLGPVQRKNAWQVAEQIGDADPYGVQYLMGRSDWDPDQVRDDLRAYLVEALGDPEAVEEEAFEGHFSVPPSWRDIRSQRHDLESDGCLVHSAPQCQAGTQRRVVFCI